jgi:hypothetical protein
MRIWLRGHITAQKPISEDSETTKHNDKPMQFQQQYNSYFRLT